MANEEPIEVPIEEARALTHPTDLLEVLETLQASGRIEHFVIRTQVVLIWVNPNHRTDVALEFESASEPRAGTHKLTWRKQ